MPQNQVASVPNLDFGAPSAGVAAVGQVLNETAVPADGDTVKLTDYRGKSLTFEFDSGGQVAAGNVLVAIGGSIAATRTNLIAVVNAAAIAITASAHATAGQTTLTQQGHAVAGNTTIFAVFATGANVTVTQFAGGIGDANRTHPLELQMVEGGQVDVTFECPNISENPVTVTLEVSDDGFHWVTTTAAANGAQVSAAAIAVNTRQSFALVLSAGQFVRLTPVGPGRAIMQTRGGNLRLLRHT